MYYDKQDVKKILDDVGEYLAEEDYTGALMNLKDTYWLIFFDMLAEADIHPFAELKRDLGSQYMDLAGLIRSLTRGNIPYAWASYFARISPDTMEILTEVMKLFTIFNIYAKYDDEDLPVNYLYSISPVTNLGTNTKLIRKGI